MLVNKVNTYNSTGLAYRVTNPLSPSRSPNIVALSGSRLGIPCTIVMPNGTPTIKACNVVRLGAKIVLHGADFAGAEGEGVRLAAAHSLVFVPPYDDPLVIARALSG